MSLHDLSANLLDGQPKSLRDYAGTVLLVVNTASECGCTPQYAGLEMLREKFKDRGFEVLAFPSNDFGGQEPGGTADIMRTAHGDYGIGFPLAAKAQVKGPNPHPFYKWAAAERPLETPRWNFHKYLVGRGRPHRRCFRHRDRADGRPRHRRDREGAAAAGIKHRHKR